MGSMYKVLFPVSEAFPLVKTGGLADVAGSLSVALQVRGCDVRLLLPAYQHVLDQVTSIDPVAEIFVAEHDTHVRLLETTLPGTDVIVWLIDHPASYLRPGDPYHDANGEPWPDNAARFALLSRVATMIALGNTTLNWEPDIVHCHDWQTALAPALISLAEVRPVTVFTIHNLAYQGLFDAGTMQELHLPDKLWSPEGLEFYGQLSFVKGGIMYADHITTVSPTYAREIQTPEFGCGLENALSLRADRLSGILNGIDDELWNPATDPYLRTNYDRKHFAKKVQNKADLQREARFEVAADIPIIAQISRLVHQKGIDLVIEALRRLIAKKARFQYLVLGNGETEFENGLMELAEKYPDQVFAMIGYDEVHAHQIVAGADMYLMPSRFEPCGLTQLFSLRYGTVPIAHDVGGLVDTVVDASVENLDVGVATGFLFEDETVDGLVHAIERGLQIYKDQKLWRKLARNGMVQNFSWDSSVNQYLNLYDSLLPMRTWQHADIVAES